MVAESDSVEEASRGLELTEPGLLPEGWDTARLGDLLKEVDVRVHEAGIESAPILSMTRHRGLVLQNQKFGKRVASRDIRNYKVVRKGQIVYGFPMDEGVIYSLQDFDVGMVSPVYEIWEPTTEAVHVPFLDKLLRTPSMIATYRRLTSNTVQRRRIVSKKDFKAISVPLPPLEEQRAIAHVLSTIQRAIEATERVIAAAREFKRSLMRHLFTYGPVPLAEAERVPLKETEIGPMPEHWEVGVLENHCHKPQYGYTATASAEPVGPRFLRITDIQDEGVSWSTVPFCKCPDDQFAKHELHAGDILIARIGATTGKSYIVPRLESPAIFASYLIRIRARTGITADFLYRFFNFGGYWSQVNASKGDKLKMGVSGSTLAALRIPLAPMREQDNVAQALSTLDRKIQAEEKRKAALKELFRTMLHLLMTGQIRVKGL